MHLRTHLSYTEIDCLTFWIRGLTQILKLQMYDILDKIKETITLALHVAFVRILQLLTGVRVDKEKTMTQNNPAPTQKLDSM